MKYVFQIVSLCLILRGVMACQHSPSPLPAPIENVVDKEPDSCGLKNVSYRTKIDSIMTLHCKGCHSGRGALKGINLESYQSTKSWFELDTTRMLESIRFERGISMPPAGKIPECDIRQIETWIQKGMPY